MPPNRRISRPVQIVIIVVSIIFIAIVVVLLYSNEHSGFGQFLTVNDANFEREKTVWDWMNLLFVPVILAGGAFWFSEQTRVRQRSIEEDRFREDTLQKYLDKMSELILETIDTTKEQRKQVAVLRTTTVLRRLDTRRKQEVIDFLKDSKQLLITDEPILKDAAMTDIDLSNLSLSLADLSGANLSGADLSGADLGGADLSGADLSLADLSGANLNGAQLIKTNLSGAYLNGTILEGANLSTAILHGAVLDDKTRFDSETLLPDDKNWSPQIKLSDYIAPPNP